MKGIVEIHPDVSGNYATLTLNFDKLDILSDDISGKIWVLAEAKDEEDGSTKYVYGEFEVNIKIHEEPKECAAFRDVLSGRYLRILSKDNKPIIHIDRVGSSFTEQYEIKTHIYFRNNGKLIGEDIIDGLPYEEPIQVDELPENRGLNTIDINAVILGKPKGYDDYVCKEEKHKQIKMFVGMDKVSIKKLTFSGTYDINEGKFGDLYVKIDDDRYSDLDVECYINGNSNYRGHGKVGEKI